MRTKRADVCPRCEFLRALCTEHEAQLMRETVEFIARAKGFSAKALAGVAREALEKARGTQKAAA